MSFFLGMVGGVLGWALVQAVRGVLDWRSHTPHETVLPPLAARDYWRGVGSVEVYRYPELPPLPPPAFPYVEHAQDAACNQPGCPICMAPFL